MTPDKRMEQRLNLLQEHLKRENPTMVDVVGKYRELDVVAKKIGLLAPGESYATRISWWPLISILGTFSAGKSSFINTYLGLELQRTGNQAVDDRFTVITYSPDGNQRTLPGLALDGDPRFPFYQISEEIELVSEGEGSRIDNYLQMKAAPSEKLRGRILIDSPGFDADAQRKAILRLTDHIIELSDLVMVFFDARHPEPGAM
ncbi:MAG TPA: dynamin family protein, partial [Thiolinea sp.]|nr:dynamin family protein [Thiolinea sp.]